MKLLQRLNDLDDKVIPRRTTPIGTVDRVGYGALVAGVAFSVSGRFPAGVVAFGLAVAASTYATFDRRRRATTA